MAIIIHKLALNYNSQATLKTIALGGNSLVTPNLMLPIFLPVFDRFGSKRQCSETFCIPTVIALNSEYE